MDNFDLRKYLAEGRLFKENINSTLLQDIEEFLKYSLDVYLEGDMEGDAPNTFTLESGEYTPEYQGEELANSFNQTANYLQKEGDIQFSSDYGYTAVASLDGGDINIRFEES